MAISTSYFLLTFGNCWWVLHFCNFVNSVISKWNHLKIGDFYSAYIPSNRCSYQEAIIFFFFYCWVETHGMTISQTCLTIYPLKVYLLFLVLSVIKKKNCYELLSAFCLCVIISFWFTLGYIWYFLNAFKSFHLWFLEWCWCLGFFSFLGGEIIFDFNIRVILISKYVLGNISSLSFGVNSYLNFW